MDNQQPRRGIDDFISYISAQAALAPPGYPGAAWFILQTCAECANIRLQDLGNLRRFLRQMAGSPPLRFNTAGFRPELVDDRNPVRHYMAFVFVGFWAPNPIGITMLYAWEMAGFVRYGGVWSPRDIACGQVGLRHGALVARFSPAVLPGLIAGELAR
ncbi:MAG: hypothetical protein IPK16_15215 [Anaerolineales bacterium]|nr:hypothetical protein [Anaerolineales bacterium]